MTDTFQKSEFEIVRTASRLFEDAANVWMERALKAEAALEAARKAFHGTALMMRGVDSWPHAESIVGHVDSAALRELRVALSSQEPNT